MLPPEFINKVYGVGSYVFVNCSDEFSGYFLLAGYNVTDIHDLSATVNDENNYDFMVINYSVPVDEIAFNESLCKYLQSLIGLKKLLIFADKEIQKSPQFIKLKAMFESIGFGYDDVIATLIGSSFDDQLYIPLVSLNLATTKDNSLKKEKNIAELVQYVRPNENVCVIYEDCNYFSTFINQYSVTREIKKFKNVESFIKASKFINDIQKQTDRKKRKYFDCIYLLNDENDITDLDALRDFSENLCPGGRIIFKSNDFQDFTPGNLFELEIAYMSKDHQLSANVCGCDIIDKDLNGYFVAMKDPLIDVENFEYVEKTYPYSSPPKNLIMFERDYYNPWLLKAIVEFPTRNKNKFALKRYAEKILQEYDSTLPDFAAAIAILGYQSFSDKNNIPIIIKRIEDYITDVDKLRKKSPHQLRWLISLAVLGAELSKIINNKHDALNLYLSAIKYPFDKFSPTIGTKVLQAYYNIAMILYTSGDRINFGKYLSEALVKGVDILNVSYKELLGSDQKPLVFTLFIYHDIIDWLIKIANLKNNLGLHDNIIPSLNDKAWSNLLKERMDAIISMNGMIKERDNAINDQGNMLEERMKGINELESVIQAQQKLIEERWEAMQEMEKMIIERDNTISELKNLI